VCEAAKVLSMSVSHRGGVYIPRNLMIYSSSTRVIIVKYSRLWWNENVARMEEIRNTYVPNFDEKISWKTPTWETEKESEEGEPEEIGCENWRWLLLTEDCAQSRAFVRYLAVLKLRIPLP
jgi:hypothetical protein